MKPINLRQAIKRGGPTSFDSWVMDTLKFPSSRDLNEICACGHSWGGHDITGGITGTRGACAVHRAACKCQHFKWTNHQAEVKEKRTW